MKQHSECNYKHLNNYLTFIDDKYSFEISFLPSFDENNLYFFLSIDDVLFQALEKFRIKLQFIDNNEESNIIWREPFIIIKEEKLIWVFENKEYEIDAVINIEKRNIIQVKIPYDHLCIDTKKRPIKVGYNVILEVPSRSKPKLSISHRN